MLWSNLCKAGSSIILPQIKFQPLIYLMGSIVICLLVCWSMRLSVSKYLGYHLLFFSEIFMLEFLAGILKNMGSDILIDH